MKCKHENRIDLTHGLGEGRNFYCPDCKTHWYKGKMWSEKEWNDYVDYIPEDGHIENFDTGSTDKGFTNVRTLGEAKDILRKLEIPFVDIVQNKFKDRRFYGGYNETLGIHMYFLIANGDEVAYYTPCMESLLIFGIPRKVGIEQDLHHITI